MPAFVYARPTRQRTALCVLILLSAAALGVAKTPTPGGAPVEPPSGAFTLVPGRDPDGWNFVLEPYAWSPGLYGQIGLKELPVAQVNQSPIDILKTLDWGLFLRGEARRGRWGLLGDGFFAQFSTSADPGAGLYRNITSLSQQSMVSLALACRVLTDRRFFVDVYAGGRYNYVGASASAEVNRAGVEGLSEDIIDRAISRFGSRLLAKYPGLKNVPASTLQQAKELGVGKLADRIEEKLPKHVEADRWWIDPIVGLRGQVNFTRWLFAAAQADAGGFGAGSDITVNTQATLGVNFSRHVALEAGYRYMYIDYDKDNFLYDVNMPGVFAGLIFKF